MVFIVETRHRIIGLRRKPGASDPSRGERLEDREAAAAGEAVNQRRDKHLLAGARQPREAEPHCWIEKVIAIIQQGPRRKPRFFDYFGKAEGHAGVKNSIGWGQIGCRTTRKVAIGGPKSSFTLRTPLQARDLNVR